jgi:hypothetical protein
VQNNVIRFGEKVDFYMLLVIGQSNGPLPEKNHKNMHPRLINMDLQGGMVIKDV